MDNTWEQKTGDEHPPRIRLDKGRVGWWWTIERWVGPSPYASERDRYYDRADGWRCSHACAEQAARRRLCRQERATRKEHERNAQTETIEVYR